MAGYYNTSKQELNDAYRLLPQEILEDIGIVDPAEQQLHDVIEDLAARLAIVLGGTPAKITSPVNASRCGLAESREILAGRGHNVPRTVAVPAFSPAPAVPCHAMAEGLRNNMVFFSQARPHGGGAGAQPAIVHRRGTGVFLPRNQGACRTARAACPLGESKSFGFSHCRGHSSSQPAMVIVKMQQEMQPMAGRMVQNYLGVHARPVVPQSRRNELITNKTRIIQ